MTSVAMIVLLTLAQIQEPTWQEQTLTEAGCQVLLPAKPQLQKMAQKAGDGSAVQILFYRTPPVKGFTVIVAVSDFADSYLQKGAAFILDSARDASVTRSRGRLVKETKVKLEDSPGRDVLIKLGNDQGYLRTRYYLVGKRQYALFAVGPDEATVTSPQAEKFLTSLKLTK